MAKIEPLRWPNAWPRSTQPASAPFAGDRTLDVAARGLLDVLDARHGVHKQPFAFDIDITANRRGDPDQGAAVYFTRTTSKGRESYVLACDKWDRAADNMWALKLHVESIRGQERWGVGEADRALAGYRALPPSPNAKPYEPRKRSPKLEVVPTWVTVLDLEAEWFRGGLTKDDVKQAHYTLVVTHHPDRGGSHEIVATINAARDEALKELSE